MVVNIVKHMKELGFTEYESRAYVALLEENPVTAYEIAKRSAIPTSKIYEVLARLLEKELILEMHESSKKRYMPVDSAEFLQKYSRQMMDRVEVLQDEFEKVKVPSNVSYILHLDRYEELIEKARVMITGAEENLLISAWPEELTILKDAINASSVKKALVQFGHEELGFEKVFFHPVETQLLTEKGGRQFVVVADSNEAISATVFEERVEGAWSQNSGFVTTAEDYVKHDVYILKVVEEFGPELVKRYGRDFIYLRDIFSDEVAT